MLKYVNWLAAQVIVANGDRERGNLTGNLIQKRYIQSSMLHMHFLPPRCVDGEARGTKWCSVVQTSSYQWACALYCALICEFSSYFPEIQFALSHIPRRGGSHLSKWSAGQACGVGSMCLHSNVYMPVSVGLCAVFICYDSSSCSGFLQSQCY